MTWRSMQRKLKNIEDLYIVKGRILGKFELIIKHGRSET